MLAVGSHQIDPPVILAPMAGITDVPFRRLVARFGAGLTVSEMVASQEMVQAKPGVRERADHANIGGAVQLAGREAYWMARAARHVADAGARIIDINMGCPAKKVTGGLSGAALMRDEDHALRLIEAVVGAVDVPVTLKMRLGWDGDVPTAPSLARKAEAAGVQMITIHGRTRCQFYKGSADWAAIRQVVDAVAIPVIANGDVVSAGAARMALEKSGARGVMIGRGAQGKPWVLAQIASELFGVTPPQRPRGSDLSDLVAGHYEDSLDFYGPQLGARVVRKHLSWYMDEAATPDDMRRKVLTEQTPKAVLHLIREAFDMAEAA